MSTDQRVDPEPLSADDGATYHGSLTELHGPCVVLGNCVCPDCGTEMVRYLAGPDPDQLPDRRLRLSLPTTAGQMLEHVRPSSFTRAPGRATR